MYLFKNNTDKKFNKLLPQKKIPARMDMFDGKIRSDRENIIKNQIVWNVSDTKRNLAVKDMAVTELQ